MPIGTIPAALAAVHERVRNDRSGEVASYIPELAAADPEPFGIAAAMVDGQIYETGDATAAFSIQSISKPFVFGLALEDLGPEEMFRRVGVEPSGSAFNSTVMDERNNRPMNPMVNAGAIATTACVQGRDLAMRLDRVVDMLSVYAGRELQVDERIFESERRTGHLNTAIAYLELNAGMIDEPVSEHLELYFKQCSVLVTAADLAVMAATLANRGVNPITGVRAISEANVTRVLSVMSSCGMYDGSGEWMYRVGLPAKSGVSGGILAVLPGQIGLGLFSPRLDAVGNSVRGVRACREFATSFNLHLFDAHPTSDTVVRRAYRGSDLPSQRVRRREHRPSVAEAGRSVQVYELQGDLFFGSAERVARVVEGALDGVRYVVLDAEHVGRTDASALGVIHDLGTHLAAHNAELVLAGFPPKWIEQVSTPEHPWAVRRFPTAASALEWTEDDALSADRLIDLHGSRVPLEQVDILHDLPSEALADLSPYLRVAEFGDREALVSQGDPADSVYFLVEGRAEVFVRVAGRPKRIRSYDAGVAFGELVLFEQQVRSADVVADGPVTCLVLGLDDVVSLRDQRPVAYQQLLVAAGRNLADLIHRQTSDLAAT